MWSLSVKTHSRLLFGLFLYIGLPTLDGNQFFNRVKLWVTDLKLYLDTHFLRIVPAAVIHKFTLIQLGCLAALRMATTQTATS